MIKAKPLDIPRLQILAGEIGEWADRNFKVHAPILGIFEEIGELAHAILKRKQGIRGFDKPEHFMATAEDAIADIAIYALHGIHKHGVKLIFLSVASASHSPEFLIADLSQVAIDLTYKTGDDRRSFVKLFTSLNDIAALENIDLGEVIEKTWAKVSKRDWVKNPTNADVAGSEIANDPLVKEVDDAGKEAGSLPPKTVTQGMVDGLKEAGKLPEGGDGKAPDGKSGETTVEKTGLAGNSGVPAESLTGNGPANAPAKPEQTIAVALPTTGDNPSGKAGTKDAHPEPNTVVVDPHKIKWSKAAPKEAGDYYFAHKNSPDPKVDPLPKTIKVLEVDGELRATSAEVELDGKPLDIAVADLGTEFTAMRFSKKDLPPKE